jgi:copper homeostasis protein
LYINFKFSNKTEGVSKSKIILEICAQSLASGLIAQEGGADRIELCSAIEIGGITPSPAVLKEARKRLDIDICVLIRPRGGDFIHSDLEFELIKKDIIYCKKLGMNGIVVGIQKPDKSLDIERMKRLHDLARPMEVVCHRAFDRVSDPYFEMEKLISIGFDRILTSGLAESAPKGRDLLRGLIEKSNGRITIMPGAGILPENVKELVDYTGATQVHMTAKKFYPEKECWETDLTQVKSTVYSFLTKY